MLEKLKKFFIFSNLKKNIEIIEKNNVCIVESYLPLLIYILIKNGNLKDTIFITSNLDIKNILKNENVIWIEKNNIEDKKYLKNKRKELKGIIKDKNIKYYGSNHIASYVVYDSMIDKITILDDGLSLYERNTYPVKCILNNKKVETIKLLGLKEVLPEIIEKTEIVDIKNIYNKQKNKKYLSNIFNITKKDIEKIKKFKIVLFTQPLSEDSILTLEEEIKLYEILLEKFKNDKILIKTHPRERKDYRKIFENKYKIEVFDKKIPVEIFEKFDIKFDIAMTLFSSAIFGINAKEKNFLGTEIHKKLVSHFGVINMEKEKKKMVKISIIVPVYNVEKYVEKCLKSLCGLKIENEIIVVNDGSTDNSLEVVKNFKENHIEENIKIINQENKGLSGARNRGIMEAKGEYISFVDSDDFVDNEKYEDMIIKTIENDLDLGIGNGRYYYEKNIEKNEEFYRDKELKDIKISNGQEWFKKLERLKSYRTEVWDDIYKKKFLLENNIKFREGKLHEDEEFMIKVFLRAKRVKYLDICFYNYFQENSSSIMKNKSLKNHYDLLDNIDGILNELSNIKDKEIIKIIKDKVKCFYYSMEEQISHLVGKEIDNFRYEIKKRYKQNNKKYKIENKIKEKIKKLEKIFRTRLKKILK